MIAVSNLIAPSFRRKAILLTVKTILFLCYQINAEARTAQRVQIKCLGCAENHGREGTYIGERQEASQRE